MPVATLLVNQNIPPEDSGDNWTVVDNVVVPYSEMINVLTDSRNNSYTYNPANINTSSPFNRLDVGFQDMPADVPLNAVISKVVVKWEIATQGDLFYTAKTHVEIRIDNPPLVWLYEPDPNPSTMGWKHYCPPAGGVTEWDCTAFHTTRPWSVADVNSIRTRFAEIYDKAGGEGAPLFTRIWLEVEHDGGGGLPPSFESGRLTAARNLRLFRKMLKPHRLSELPPWLASFELLDDILVSSESNGFGDKRWQRSWDRILESSLDLSKMSVDLVTLPVSEFSVMVWDAMLSSAGGSIFSQGVARLGSGSKRTFVRATNAWIRNGSVPTQIIKAVASVEKITDLGTYIEEARTNFLIESSFRGGTGTLATGWTLTSQVIAGVSLPWVFEDNNRHLTISITNAAVDSEATSTATAAFIAGDNVVVSVLHHDATGHAMGYWAQRGSDAMYWRDSDSTWQVAKTWNMMPIVSAYTSHASKFIPIGATTLVVGVGVPAGGVVGANNHVGHVQIEKGKYPTSPIVTYTTAIVRDADVLSYENLPGARTWPAESGRAAFQFRPEWTQNDLTSDRTFLQAWHDASNYDDIRYDYAAAQVVFRRVRAGVSFAATKSLSPVRGTLYAITARWSGANSEQGLAPYTMSIFIDAVKGTDVVASGPSNETSTSTLRVGHRWDGTVASQFADAAISHLDIVDEVSSDDDIKALP